MSQALQSSPGDLPKRTRSRGKSTLRRMTEVAIAIGALVGAVYALGTKVIAIQRLVPEFYYGLAADSCLNPNDFSVALRAGNAPLVRCLIEKQGQSATAVIPANMPHANHYPIALVAESCNYRLVKYLVLLRGADPRNGHGSDTPAAIARSHCDEPERTEIVQFLEEQVRKISPRGR